MMTRNIKTLLCIALMAGGITSCTDSNEEPIDGKTPMSFSFLHPSQSTSRATDTSFETGDKVGLFLSECGKELEIAANTLNNESLTFTGSAWKSDRNLFWDSGSYNAYAYYPRLDDIISVSDLPFSIATDQRATNDGGMDGYQKSDFLFASAKEIRASADPVNLQFRHIMSKLTVRLIKGEDFEGELPATATVYIHNTVTEATIDLSAGVATKNARKSGTTVIARQAGPAAYTAIIVPQRLENRVPLIEVVMNGVSFLYESKFLFKSGIHHIVNLVVDKNPEQVKIEIGGEITEWN